MNVHVSFMYMSLKYVLVSVTYSVERDKNYTYTKLKKTNKEKLEVKALEVSPVVKVEKKQLNNKTHLLNYRRLRERRLITSSMFDTK